MTISGGTEKRKRRTNVNGIFPITLSLLYYILLREIPKSVMVYLFNNLQWISLASVAQSSWKLMKTSVSPASVGKELHRYPTCWVCFVLCFLCLNLAPSI